MNLELEEALQIMRALLVCFEDDKIDKKRRPFVFLDALKRMQAFAVSYEVKP